MNLLDTLIVTVIVLGALLYLYRVFRPKQKGGNCGCGSIDCKVPKPRIHSQKADHRPPEK